MSTADKDGRGVVSEAERRRFVEAVLSGKLAPEFIQVAYHFAGWLDSDVVDAVIEVSAGPSDAVSALAGMSPATLADDEASTSSAGVIASSAVGTASSGGDNSQAAAAGTSAAAIAAGDAYGGKKRHALTLGAMQAQRASGISGSPSGDERLTGAEAQKGVAVDGGTGRDNSEFEKVSAFISSYAGEQDAAAKASGAAVEPPKPPFFVPRGTIVPSTRKTQLVITNTAEKTVDVPGFEAFMKMQHGKDALFRFLASDHPLHSYYLLAKKHVQEAVMKGGKAKGACTAVPQNPPPPKAEDPGEVPRKGGRNLLCLLALAMPLNI
ncbi:unnamed protein product [Laminaria digitata]